VGGVVLKIFIFFKKEYEQAKSFLKNKNFYM